MHLPDDWDYRLDALERALERPDRRTETIALTSVVAVREIESWARMGKRRRSDRGRRDWEYLVRDLMLSFKDIGPALGAETRRNQELLVCVLNQPKSYDNISNAAVSLLASYRTSRACGAAWDDLVTASEAGDYDTHCCRREIFLDVARLNSLDLSTFGTQSLVVDVLTDAALAIETALEALGDVQRVGSFDPMRRTGTTLDDRLHLARRIWTSDTRQAHNIVWLVYERAKVDDAVGPIKVGRITFLSCARLLWALQSSESGNVLPDVAKANRQDILSWCPPDESDQMTIAMVDLGRGPIGEAVSQAHEICEATLDIFGREAGYSWLAARTMIHFINRRVGPQRHGPGVRRPGEWRSYDNGGLSAAMRARGFEIGDDLPIESLREPLNLLQVLYKTSSATSEVLIAATRGLELVRANTDSTQHAWPVYVRHMLRERWIVSEAIRSFTDSLLGLDSDRRRSWQTGNNDTARFHDLIRGFRTSGGVIDLAAMVDDAVTAIRLVEPNWLPARKLKRAAQVLSPSTAPRLVNRLNRRFDSYLARLARCRNITTHGGSDCAGSAESVRTFACHIGCLALNSYSDALILGQDPADTMNQRRQKAVQELSLLAVGDLQNVAAARDPHA